MARIAMAGLVHETNSFAPMVTTYEDFAGHPQEYTGLRGAENLREMQKANANMAPVGFMDKIESLGHEVVPILFTGAQPAGHVTTDAFDRLTAMILEGMRQQGPFDGVYLGLHGAMVTDDYEDAEIEIQRRVRSVVGDIPVVASLDLHGNILEQAVEEFSALVGYRSYPHIDMYTTGERAALLMDHLLQGKPLYKAFRRIPYLISPSTASSFVEPCVTIYKDLDEIEKDPQVVSLTFMHGFLLSDIHHVGPTVFAYAVTQAAADSAADRLEESLLDHEADFALNMLSADEAVELAMQKAKTASKPIILADVQDNAGGGGTSDTVWVLDALVSHNAQDAALALMYDPQAAEAIHAAGAGSQVTLDLGGKLMPGHKPFHGTFMVEKLFEGEFPLTGPMSRGMPADMGKMAQIRIGGVRVVVCSKRKQNNDQAYFRVAGIEPTQMKILVVKSTNHYRADYQPIASEIIMVEAPGAHVENPLKIPYTRLREGVRMGGMGPVYTKK